MTDVITLSKKAFTWSVVVVTVMWSMGAAALMPLVVNADSHCGEDLEPGDTFMVEGNSGVFMVTEDLEFMSFPSAAIYKSWFMTNDYKADWSGYTTLTKECAGNYDQRRDDPNYVGYFPGSLIQDTQSFSSKVYVVGNDHTVAHIPDEATAAKWFGDNWASKINGVTNPQALDYTLVDSNFPVAGMRAMNGDNHYVYTAGGWSMVDDAPSNVR